MDKMQTPTEIQSVPPKPVYKRQLVWKMVFTMVILHVVGIYGWYLWFTQGQMKMKTFVFGYVYAATSGVGVTAGAHRLWAHRTYKATWQARFLLMLAHTAALQNCLYEWCRDHRVHHKFSETDADPHNAKRGFWFAHVGWLMMKKHPDVLSKGKSVDMSDIAADPVVAWQRKHYWYMAPLLAFVVPGLAPWYLWGESFWVSVLGSGMARYVSVLNVTWLVNSAAHLWGSKPYDKSIGPVQSLPVIILAAGEGYHNYHHTFPWDYKAAELGNDRFNFTTKLIDMFALLGWAYDLKSVSSDLVQRRAKRTGDGSKCSIRGTYDHKETTSRGAMDTNSNGIHRSENKEEECETQELKNDGAVDVVQKIEDAVWGWGDVDMKHDDVRGANIFCPRVAQAGTSHKTIY